MTVSLAGTGKELAQELAMTHETLYRTLAALEKEGKFSRGEGSITIPRNKYGLADGVGPLLLVNFFL
jgi:DNA-binding HxlR family transcriptional regulator